MEFRVLGPLEVTDDGRTLELGGAKQRALLAVLLLHANEVVSTDRLIDALWDEQPPEGARKTLQVYVSGLRKALGKDRLRTQAPGYRLHVETDELDVARFERLAAEGRFGEALALWRGAPLQEFAYQPFTAGEIVRMEELRLGCVEGRIEAELEQGRHSALVGELERLVREHPLRERPRAQLMLALYRSGRQAEALDVYAEARRALVDELGIEPSRELRELEGAILRQDPHLDLGHPTAGATAVETVTEPSGPSSTAAAGQASELRPGRKTVTVLHVLAAVTSDEGADLDPEVLQRVQTRAFREIASVIEAHQGSVLAVTGDSVSGVFGLPAVHEDDPVRATRAAEDLRARLSRLASDVDAPTRLQARIGVSTGPVMTGGTASPLPVTGGPLTSAARLAQEAGPEETLVDDATRRAVGARRDGSRFVSPMVGRERERRRLHDAFEQAVGDRSCQLFTILGAAGVGKSRLVQEFLADLEGHALVARGRCLPYGEGITLWPVLEAVTELAGLDDADTPDEARERLAALVEGEADADAVAGRVIDFVGLTEEAAGVDEGFRAVRSLFELVAARRPLVVVFDDLHWGEGTFLDLVEHLADWSRGAPLLLVCMARPELLDVRTGWSGGKLNATSVLLEPLSEHECEELVLNLVGEATITDEVQQRIAGAAEGNPLFVEEVLSMLIDDGLLVRENGRWAAAGSLTDVPIPPTIHALLAARLDQLGPEERAVIEPAAVEGKVFHESSVALLAPDPATVGDALQALVRKELIRPERPVFAGERAFRFRHLMIRDAAYDAISKEARARLHERHVEWLEARSGERSVEFDEIAGYHLEQALRYKTELGDLDEHSRELGRRAAERLGAAGRRAFQRGDASAGANLISRAAALLAPDDPLRIELVPSMRAVQGAADLSWADQILTDSIEAAATAGDRSLAAHALVQRRFLRLFSDPGLVTPNELLEVSRRAIGVFEAGTDDVGLARAYRLGAQAHYLDRRLDASAEASERALAHARASGDRFEEHEVTEWLLTALLFGPCPARAGIARCTQLLAEAEVGPLLESLVAASLAWFEAADDDVGEATRLVDVALRAIEGHGQNVPFVSFYTAQTLTLLDDWERAEALVLQGYEPLRALGRIGHFGAHAVGFAEIRYRQGRDDEAHELLDEGSRASRANDVWDRVHGLAVRAKLLARAGDVEAADARLREAVALADASDFLTTKADVQEALAEVLLSSGRERAAERAIRLAISLHEQKGNRRAVARAGAMLEEV